MARAQGCTAHTSLGPQLVTPGAAAARPLWIRARFTIRGISASPLIPGRYRQQLTTPQASTMASLKSPLRQLCSLLFFFVALASALKFDLAARGQHENKPWRCIRNFVGKDTLVVVTATVSGYRGDGMVVNMHVRAEESLGSGLVGLTDTVAGLRRRRQRVWQAQGHRRRAEDGLHVPR